MSVLGSYTKQPGEVETYSIDYADDLTENDNLVSASATTSGADTALSIATTWVIDNPGDQRVRVRVTGGNVGVKYKITVVTLTADGRTLEDEFYVKIKAGPPREPRPMIERIGLAVVALILGTLFGGVAAASQLSHMASASVTCCCSFSS